MDGQKQQAINDFLERRKENAKREFQQKVDAALNNISSLSRQLKEAKKTFVELTFEEPESIDV